MIPWFFRQDKIRSFPHLSAKKKNKHIMETNETNKQQLKILENRISSAKELARRADRMIARKRNEKAREAMREFKLDLVSSQPVLNAYVSTSLEKSVLDVMSIEGFEFPDLLVDLRKDIDFGLFAINSMDELEHLLTAEIDPFKELGLDIDADFA